MQTDSYLTQGYTHLTGGKPCQDYSLAGELSGGGAYAIVSDGCSTGGHTDIGARILTLAMAQALRSHWSSRRDPLHQLAAVEIGAQARAVTGAAAGTLSVPEQDTLATCAYAYVSPAGGFAHVEGDGVVAWRSTGGDLTMVRFDWAENLPFYPTYTSDDCARFIEAHGGDVHAVRLMGQWRQRSVDGQWSQRNDSSFTLGEGIRGITVPLPNQGLETVAVFTDGVTQIEGVDWWEAVYRCMAFRTTAGEFAKRRVIRVVKDSRQDGHGPLDDLACAMIHVSGR